MKQVRLAYINFEELVPNSLRITADNAAEYIIANPEKLPLLFDGINLSNPKIALRVSRVFLLIFELQPTRIDPYIKDIYYILLKSENGSVVRNFLNIMQFAHNQLNENELSGFIDFCFKILEDHNSEIAHEALALSSLYEVSKLYPDLKSELISMIELRYEESSPAFQAKSRQIIKKLNRGIIE